MTCTVPGQFIYAYAVANICLKIILGLKLSVSLVALNIDIPSFTTKSVLQIK